MIKKEQKEKLTICLIMSDYSHSSEIITILNNSDGESYKITARKLKEYFRYDGIFKFEDDLPF